MRFVPSAHSDGEYGWTSAFPLSVLTVSSTAKAKGIDNQPYSSAHDANLSRLSDFMAKLPFDFRVTSGYRSPELNTAIGGSKTSQHPNGLAVDASPLGGKTNRDVAAWLYANQASFPELDQVIWYDDSTHVHIGICPSGATNCARSSGPRGEFLNANKEGGVYLPWAPTAEETVGMALRVAKTRPVQTAGMIWAAGMAASLTTLGFLLLLDRKIKRKKARKSLKGAP